MENSQINALMIDAGGVKGIYALVITDGLSKKFGINFNEDFHQYAGTSVGSVIAAALAFKITPGNLLENFSKLENDFEKGHVFMTARLFDLIDDLFGKALLSEIEQKLFVPVYNLTQKSLCYISNKEYPDLQIAEVLKAACSDIRIVEPYQIQGLTALFTDAGFFAYDPTMFFLQSKNVLFDARLKILSIGSGLIENVSADLNMGNSTDIIYDSFLQTQFETTKFFFDKISKATGVIYCRISEFPNVYSEPTTIKGLVQLAKKRLSTINELPF